jgi:SAM-dependent methyltransferase
MTPGIKPPASSRATTILTVPAWPRPLRSVDGPHHPRRLRPPHRHPGIVIFDGPSTFGTTVITVVAPGVVQEERRFADGPSSVVPGRGPDQVAPFDPTPYEVVERLLALARVKKGDVIYDLGSGDGRILIAAAKKYGARGVGYEIDAGLVKLARENVRRAGLEKLVEIRQEDFLAADLSPASVVTLYLSYDGNLALRDQLNRQLKPGARVVSYAFDMGDWQPKVSESYRDAAGNVHQLYLWEITKQALARQSSDPIIAPYPAPKGPLIIEVN